MKKTTVFVTLLGVALSAYPVGSQEPTSKGRQLKKRDEQQRDRADTSVSAKGVEPFMQRKLVHVKNVLEGVVLKDFDRVAKHGQQLSLLSLDAGWQVIQSSAYAQQSAEFRRAAGSLVEAAEEKNLDAAALAYVDLTMKCVNCHKRVRAWHNAPKASRRRPTSDKIKERSPR